MVHNPEDPIFQPLNVQEYFKDSITDALHNQNLDVDDHTVYYVVNLLTHFTSTEELFDDQSPDGLHIKPLALMFADALETASTKERTAILRRLGDVSLYISGFFSGSLSRKIIDIDYYIGMGGNAYGSLADAVRGTIQGEVFSQIFRELATKFESFVDVLSEVSEQSNIGNNQDILRLYNMWIRTGSKRAHEKLSELGIQPMTGVKTRLKH